MTVEAALSRRRNTHNLLTGLRGLAWLVVAAVSWVISWHALWWLFAVPTYMLGQLWRWSPSARMCDIAAWVGIVLLAVEGIRYSKRLFDIEEYARSAYYKAFTIGSAEPMPTGNALVGNPLGVPYLISQALFIAPRSSVKSLFAFKSIILMNDSVVEAAHHVINDLARNNRWTTVQRYREHAHALAPLEKLNILQHHLTAGVVEVRLDRDFLNEQLGQSTMD